MATYEIPFSDWVAEMTRSFNKRLTGREGHGTRKPVEHKVASESDPSKEYTVTQTGSKWTCDCPSFKYREQECKHIASVKP